MKRIYLFNIVAWNYRKKTGFPVCKKENFAGLEAHQKRGKSARASPTPHHTLNEERSARFTAQPLSALVFTNVASFMQIYWNKRKSLHKKRVQLPQDWFGIPTWPPWRHEKTLYNIHDVSRGSMSWGSQRLFSVKFFGRSKYCLEISLKVGKG